MRALILVAGAALAVSACSSNDNANNTLNVDENLTTTDVNATTTEVNATETNAMDMNAAGAMSTTNTTTTTTTNNAM